MFEDIVKTVSRCQVCQHGYVTHPDEYKEETKELFIGSRHNLKLFDEWSIDLITKLPVTVRKCKYLLVAVEAVSGFVEAFPLKNKDAESVSGALLHLFCRYAAPRRLRSDRGSEFQGAVEVLCEEFGIIQVKTSAHHPQANGQVERKNADIMRSLEKAIIDDEDWDIALDATLLGLRIIPSRRTGLSPYEVIFGEAPRMPLKLKYKEEGAELPLIAQGIEHVDMKRFISDRSAEHKARWIRIRDKIKKYQDSMKPKKFKSGEFVMVRNFGRKKGESRWIGPFVVLRETVKGIEIKSAEGNPRLLSLADVKRYVAPPINELEEESVVGDIPSQHVTLASQ
jgi:transposase InsO family protein